MIASQRSAHIEAINHISKGLDLLAALPDTSERIQQELTLQIALGAPLIATKGYTAPEVEHAYARALELCRHIAECSQRFQILWGLSAFYGVRAELATARELSEQLLGMAQGERDSALLLAAHHALGQYLYFQGDFASAREHFEQGVRLYDKRQHSSLAFVYGQDPGMACLSYLAWTLWFLGYADQAVERSQQALSLAQGLAHPVSLAFAQVFAAALHQLRGETRLTQERAEAAISLSSEHGFQYWLTLGTLYQGWVVAELGQPDKGTSQIRHGLGALGAMGANLGQPYFLARLAGAYEKAGQPEEGLAAVADALATLNETGEQFYKAEIYRLKDDLTLAERTVQGLGVGVAQVSQSTVQRC